MLPKYLYGNAKNVTHYLFQKKANIIDHGKMILPGKNVQNVELLEKIL